MQGRLKTDRTLRSDHAVVLRNGAVLVVVVVVVALALPALATAGSLLSGYGGPGQGSQQLLGSSVIGGGAGSGGGSGGGGSGQGTASGGESLGLGAASSPGSSPSGERTQSGASGSSGSGAGGAGGGGRVGKGGGSGAGQSGSRSHSAAGTSGAAVIAYPKVSVERAYLAGGGSGSAAWESGVWPYVLLALAVVVLAGALTRRLVAGKGSGGHRSLKGRVAGPE